MAGVAGSVLIAAGIFVCAGLYMLQPNETAVLTLFGRYIGTDRGEGLRWAFPLYRKHKLTVRARNLNIPILKVNDKRGNPVEVAAAVVWRVRTRRRPCSRSTISSATWPCRPRRRCATWPRNMPTTKAKTSLRAK
jgi:regulator of protease activity HflC (stomatin/prohibitin superfamily)